MLPKELSGNIIDESLLTVDDSEEVSHLDLSLTQTDTPLYTNTDTTFTIAGTVGAIDEEIPFVEEHTGIFGEYTVETVIDESVPVSGYFIVDSEVNPVASPDTTDIMAYLMSYGNTGIPNQLVSFAYNQPNENLVLDIDVPYALDSETTLNAIVSHREQLLDSYTKTTTGSTVYDIGLNGLGLDLSDKDFTLEYDFTPYLKGSVILIGATSEYTTSPAKSNYRIGVGVWTNGEVYYTVRTASSTNIQTTANWELGTTKHCKIVKRGTTVSYYCDDVHLGDLTVNWWSNYTDFSIYGYCWNTSQGNSTVENIVLTYRYDDLEDIVVRIEEVD